MLIVYFRMFLQIQHLFSGSLGKIIAGHRQLAWQPYSKITLSKRNKKINELSFRKNLINLMMTFGCIWVKLHFTNVQLWVFQVRALPWFQSPPEEGRNSRLPQLFGRSVHLSMCFPRPVFQRYKGLPETARIKCSILDTIGSIWYTKLLMEEIRPTSWGW